MVDLITATQCLKQLREANEVDFKMPYFSQLAKEEKLPFHHKPGSPKKYYKYEEVKQALSDIKHPGRDAQRAANKEKRSDNSLFDAAGSYASIADMTDDEKDDELKKKREQLAKLKKEAKEIGLQDDEDLSTNIDELNPKELNIAILKQDLRIKTAKADEAEGQSMPVEDVERQLFTASRLIRDGLLGIPARLATRLAAESDAHVCRTMMEVEINQQLNNLSEVFNES